jgi:hypothetical protein
MEGIQLASLAFDGSSQHFLDHGLYELLVLVAVPTATMIFGSLMVLFVSPSETVQAILSAFAGSLLLGSIAFELGPELVDPIKCQTSSWRWGILCGFAVSYATIIVLDSIGACLDPPTAEDNGLASDERASEASPLLDKPQRALHAQRRSSMPAQRRPSLPAFRRGSYIMDGDFSSAILGLKQGTAI